MKDTRLHLVAVVALLVVSGNGLAGGPSLVEPASYRSLYTDQRATKVGDTLTVVIIESAAAESRAESTGDRSFDLNASLIKDDEVPRAGVSIERESSGEGSTTRVGTVRAQLSARVEKILDSGDFFVRGQQSITINGEQQRIAVEGVARRWDIAADNSILSSRLLNPKIEFVGQGWVDGSQQPGLLERVARFFGF